MQQNPFKALAKSRKFWLLILDTVITLAVFFVGRYLSPDDALPYLTVIGALQPLFVFVINGITQEDVALKSSIYWGGVKGTGLPEKYGFTVEPDEPSAAKG